MKKIIETAAIFGMGSGLLTIFLGFALGTSENPLIPLGCIAVGGASMGISMLIARAVM